MNKFVLASASPRRKQLLYDAGFDFEIKIADIDETFPEFLSPQIAVQQTAIKKAAAVVKKGMKNRFVIGADTVVVLDNKILGKPKNEAHAFEMLSALSGRTHEVMTGVCVIKEKDGYTASFCETTKVTFRKLTPDEINEYIKTKIPMDKAGAYGVQNDPFSFVSKIEGDYKNVVGLPITPLKKFLEDEFELEMQYE